MPDQVRPLPVASGRPNVHTCMCTPTCALRSANPRKIARVRPDGPGGKLWSPYQAADTRHGLAAHLARYVVLLHHPDALHVATDYWLHSAPYYRMVTAAVERLMTGRTAAKAAYSEVVERPDDGDAEVRLAEMVSALLRDNPEHNGVMSMVLSEADRNIYIDHHRGSAFSPTATGMDLARVRGLARPPARHAGSETEVLVVIPLMDRGPGERVRNLLACLCGLRDQTLPAPHYRVTVVEFDAYPRWRELVAPLVDHYIHLQGDGLFNKSWALNAGVCQTPGTARSLCLLDADILVDREFLARNHARMGARYAAHLPHTEMLSLDPVSSDRSIAHRCARGEPAPSLAALRGWLLRDVPGACLWITPELFHLVGGFDERYRGWGGEDEDMVMRCAAAGALAQYDDVFLHLAHARPAMRRDDGQPFNGHIRQGTWTGAASYGRLTGPSSPMEGAA